MIFVHHPFIPGLKPLGHVDLSVGDLRTTKDGKVAGGVLRADGEDRVWCDGCAPVLVAARANGAAAKRSSYTHRPDTTVVSL
jgi:hypothetical protein